MADRALSVDQFMSGESAAPAQASLTVDEFMGQAPPVEKRPPGPVRMAPKRPPAAVSRDTAADRTFQDLAPPPHRVQAEQAQLEETGKFAEQERTIGQALGEFATSPLGFVGTPPPVRSYAEGVLDIRNKGLAVAQKVGLPSGKDFPQLKPVFEAADAAILKSAEVADFLLTPAGIATVGTLGLGPAFVRAAVGAGFQTDMAMRAYQSWKGFLEDPSPKGAVNAIFDTALIALPTAAEIAKFPVSARERKAIFDFRQGTVETYRNLRERYRGAPEAEVLPAETPTPKAETARPVRETAPAPSAQEIVQRETIRPGVPMSAAEARAAETTEQAYRRLFDEAAQREQARAQGRPPGREARRRAVEPPESAQPAIEEAAKRLGVSAEKLSPEDQAALVRIAEEEFGPGFANVQPSAVKSSARLPESSARLPESSARLPESSARAVQKAAQPVAETPQPAPAKEAKERSDQPVVRVPLRQLHLDPQRFQFKRDVGEGGAGTELRDITEYNREAGGVLLVWRDPADGLDYVVNGHNRTVAALRIKGPDYQHDVRYSVAKTAGGARVAGALMNIQEGRGTAVDAAKIFRDSAFTENELQATVALKGTLAQQGLALSKLDQPIFDRVVQGEIPTARGVIIGDELPEAADQRALVQLLDKSKKQITNSVLEELIKFVKPPEGKPRPTEVTLFGAEEVARSFAWEKAEISDYVRDRLGKERRLFGAVSTEGKAAELGKAGNVIQAGKNREIAQRAAQAEEIYGKLSTATGPIGEALEVAARDLAAGRKNANTIKERAFESIRAEISKTLGGGAQAAAPGTGRVAKARTRATEVKGSAAPPAPGSLKAGVEAGKKRDAQRRKLLEAEGIVDISDAPLVDPQQLAPEQKAARLLTARSRDISFRPAKKATWGSLPPRIYLSDEAADVLEVAVGTKFDGVTMLPHHRVEIADKFARVARNPRADAETQAIANRMAEAFRQAPEAKGVMVIRAGERIKATIRHEQLHVEQAELAAEYGFNALGEQRERFLEHPVVAYAAKQLRLRSPRYFTPAVAANEIPAFLGSGEAHVVLVNDVEAVDVLDHYFSLMKQEHGEKWLPMLDKVVPSIRRRLRERLQQKESAEPSGAQAANQPQPAIAGRGLGPGREARAREGVQPALSPRREAEQQLAVNKFLFPNRELTDGDKGTYVGSGTPVKILERGRAGRLLIEAEWAGKPYYGWIDKNILEPRAQPGSLFAPEALKEQAKPAGIEKARGEALTKSMQMPERDVGKLPEKQASLFPEDEESPLFMLRNERGQFTAKQKTRDVVAEGAEYAAKPGVFRAVVDFLRPTETRIREEGPAGKEIMRKHYRAKDLGEVAAGKRVVQLLDSGLAKLTHEQRTVDLLDALQGRAEASSPEVAEAMAGIRGITDETAAEAKAAKVMQHVSRRLKPGEPVPPEAKLSPKQQERRAAGERIAISYRRPFPKRQNYYPHIIPSSDALRSGKIRADVIDNLVRQGVRKDKEAAAAFLDNYRRFIDHGGRLKDLESFLVESGQATNVDEANQLLSQFRKRSIKRQGSLEHSRQVDLPFYDPDPLRVLPPFVHSTSLRLAQIREFGQENQVLNKLIRQVEDHPNAIEVRAAVDKIIGLSQQPDTGTAKVARFARMLQGFRLGLSFIPNATQGALNTLLKSKDLGTVFAGARGLLSAEGRRFAMQSGASLEGVISSMIRYAGGESEALGKFLTATGFTPTERANRIFAANAGAHYAGKMFKRLQNNPADPRARHTLEELGLDPEATLKKGKLAGDDVLLVAKKFSDLTQFRADPEVLPLFASSELGKVVFQFKNYIYGQTRLVYDETVTEIREGRPGEALKTLAVLAIAFPIAGEIITDLRNAITGKERKDKGLERYFNNVAAAGTLGVVTDLLQSGGYQRGVEFLAGPSISEGGRVINTIAQNNRARNLGKLAFQRVPLVGPILVNRLFPPGTDRQRAIRELYEAKGSPEFREKARESVEKGIIGREDVKTILRAPQEAEEVRQFRHLSIEEALDKYKEASSDEQKALKPILRDKLARYYRDAKNLPAQRREKVNKLIREVFPR